MNTFIKGLMDEHQLNQKQLAEILGISSSAISQWKECSTMSVDILFKLSKLFQVTIDELVNERYAVESPEQQWERLYNLESYNVADMVDRNDKEGLLEYFQKLKRVNATYYRLLYRFMVGKASELETAEMETLNRFFIGNPFDNAYFYNKEFRRPAGEGIREWVAEVLNEAIGVNNEKAYIWELERIYKCKMDIVLEALEEMVDDDDIFYAWYDSQVQYKKDAFITQAYASDDGEYIYELMKHGGRIIHTEQYFSRMSYNYADVKRAEGEVNPVPEADEIMEIIMGVYEVNGLITYEKYHRLINNKAMLKIEMEHKHKKRNPIKYWEMIKEGVI